MAEERTEIADPEIGPTASEFAAHMRPDILYAIKQIRVHQDLPRALDALERMSEQISDQIAGEPISDTAEVVPLFEQRIRQRWETYRSLMVLAGALLRRGYDPSEAERMASYIDDYLKETP